MFCLFIKDRSNVVFWFSYKGGCSYVKGLFFRYVGLDNVWPHHFPEINMPRTHFPYNDEISNPVHILFSRNPYKRVVSGFLEKLTAKHDCGGEIDWEYDTSCTFESFISGLGGDPLFGDRHFSPQTAGAYDPEIKFDRIYDVEHIDRQYLDQLFQKTVEDPVYKGYFTPYRLYEGDKPAYRLTIAELNQMSKKPTYHQFYNDEIRQAVEELFAEDFNLFRQLGMDYRCE